MVKSGPKAGMVYAVLALLGACSHRAPGDYALAPAEAFARLQQADVDDFRNARQCGVLIHFSRTEAPGQSLTWHVTSSGDDVAHFTVRLEPAADGGTHTVIEIPAAPGKGEIYDGNQVYFRPALRQPLRPALQELVDAAIEQRKFDSARLPDPANYRDAVCDVQNTALEAGKPFSVNDPRGGPPPASHSGSDNGDTHDASQPDASQPIVTP